MFHVLRLEPGPPLEFAVSDAKATSLLATWLPPPDLNGELSNYKINYKITSEFSWKTVETNATSIEIEGLLGCYQYELTLQASTANSTLYSSSSQTWAETNYFEGSFGITFLVLRIKIYRKASKNFFKA